MDYNFETLGDERFQKLCQAILVSAFPNTQCLPVGQPDGGRDAFLREDEELFIFQVKYSRNPSSKDERIAVSDVITSEKKKVEYLIKKGAKKFYLLTNVSGTAHLDNGSIDKVNEELTKAFGIPSYCWWRDDIDRRVETTNSLIWRYPDIFRGSDFLEILTSKNLAALNKTKSNTFRSYVTAQYQKDSEVRFQQVQIQNSLIDLFTDTPIGLAREKAPSPEVCQLSERMLSYLANNMHHHRYAHAYDNASDTLAADLLMKIAPDKGLQRIVLEGAPGQGKSTVTQYIAQLNRMRTLRKTSDIEKVNQQHLSHLVRLPLRVDLRDYASWLIGNDPFATEKGTPRPANGLDSLESFLSYQIYSLSGGREFSVDDLLATLQESHCLLILDGFDEVADKVTRSRLIEQIRTSSERLASDCTSLQVIVTSRPAAFILAPGFPEREWLHLSLLPMRLAQIGEYTDKWIAARNFSISDGRDFKELLLDRVSRSHIRSLAQNPMQLAILLSLISARGRSLPDKRTALYDSYMDLFFGREAEKDETVRENRDVLIQIHQYVAWKLQVDAERPGGSGSISHADLETLVKDFVLEKQHDGDVLKLFTGAVERVGALVSRVQGMLEFEVQPLREYFTGRFLYETAPYSPAGNEKGGTRPERFDALARRPYWLNVARFYAGCYNSGELSSLVSGLKYLNEGASLAVSSHIMQIAVLLLNDWVFSQEPRTVKEVIAFLCVPANLRILAASRTSWEDDRLSLPEKSGRSDLASKIGRTFIAVDDPIYRARLGLILRQNSATEERWHLWKSIRTDENSGFLEAKALGIFSDSGPVQIQELIDIYGSKALISLITSSRWNDLSRNQRENAVDSFAKESVVYTDVSRDGRSTEKDVGLFLIFMMLNPYVYAYIPFDTHDEIPFREFLGRYGFYVRQADIETEVSSLSERFRTILLLVRDNVDLPIRQWRTSLDPWSSFIENARKIWGDTPRIFCIAAVAAGIRSKEVRAAGFSDVLDHSQPLAERARYARLKPAVNWWKDSLCRAVGTDEKVWVLMLALAWAPGAVLKSLLNEICVMMDTLDDESWRNLLNSVRAIVTTTSETRNPISGFDEKLIGRISSQRARAVMLLRFPRVLAVKSIVSIANDFDGSDEIIGKFIFNKIFYEAFRDQKLWKILLNLPKLNDLKYRNQHVVSDNYDRYYYGRSESIMSIGIASELAASHDTIPFDLLEVTELTATRLSEQTNESLGSFSKERNWFDHATQDF